MLLTEKPNLPGWSANKRLRRVDFPVPLGPETTIGRWCFVVVVVVVVAGGGGGGMDARRPRMNVDIVKAVFE